MKDQFDKIADIYDKIIPKHIVSHYLNKRIEFIKRYFTKGLVLDIGCGTGLLDSQLIKENFRVIGLDVSLKMLGKALEKNTNLVCSSAKNLPFRTHSFDLIISVVTLHHIAVRKDILDSIKEMVRVIKPKSKLIIWEHNLLNPYWSLFMHRLPQDKGIRRLVNLREIIEDLKVAGIKKISAQRLGFIPDFVPRLLLKPWQILEKIVENTPLLNIFCAHNIVIGEKEGS